MVSPQSFQQGGKAQAEVDSSSWSISVFYSNRALFKECQLLSRYVMHVTEWSNSVFVNRLVTHVRKALNLVSWSKITIS